LNQNSIQSVHDKNKTSPLIDLPTSAPPFVPFNQIQQQSSSQPSFVSHGPNYATSVANNSRKNGGRYVQLTPAVQEEVGRRARDKQGILGAVRGVVGSIPFLAPMLQRPDVLTNPGSPEQATTNANTRDRADGPPKTPLHPPLGSQGLYEQDENDNILETSQVTEEETVGTISIEDWTAMSEKEKEKYIAWLESIADAKLKELQ